MVRFLLNNVNLAEVIISFCSMLLSVVAISISIFTIKAQIRHNINSVSPFCQIEFETINKKSVLWLRNSGMGIMIIQSITYSIPKKNILNKTEISDILCRQRFDKYLEWNYCGDGISAGESRELFEIEYVDYAQLNQTIDYMADIVVDIAYMDIYKNKKQKSFHLGTICEVLKKAQNEKQRVFIFSK